VTDNYKINDSKGTVEHLWVCHWTKAGREFWERQE